MTELRSYLKHEVPRDIACQIRSYIRIQWPGLNSGLTAIWRPAPDVPLDRMTFVLVDGELLISHAEANFHDVDVAGVRRRVGGLSAVFTYPAHRGKGAGQQVVAAASDYLRRSGVEFALLFCGERAKPLYLRSGWDHLPDLHVTFGDQASPTLFDEGCPPGIVMTLFPGEPPPGLRQDITARPIYVGAATW